MSGEGRPVILFLNHWAAHLGGAELSLLDVIKETVRCGAHVHLLTSENGPLIQKASGVGATCHVIPCSHNLGQVRRGNLVFSALKNLPSIFSFLAFTLRVHSVVNRLQPAIIHANVPKSHFLLILLNMLGYQGKKVFHMREIFINGTLPFFLYSWFFPHSGKVLTISYAVQERLPLKMKTRSVVVHNGVLVSQISSLNIPKTDGVSFVYLGRIVPWKGCHILIKAFVLLRRKHPDKKISLTLAGGSYYWDISYRDHLEELIETAGVQPFCSLRSHIDDIYSFLPRFHVFCTAALDEPFGRSVAEAAACALPVIAFNSGGIPEVVVNDSGLLVQGCNPESFAESMEKFVLHPELICRMGSAAHERVKQFFNSSMQIPRIVKEIFE